MNGSQCFARNVYKRGSHVWTNQLQLYRFRRKGRDKDRGKNGYPPQTRNKALEKSRLRISSKRNRSMRRMKHHKDKENGRLLDIELLSEENLGTVKIQEEDRTLNQGMLTDNVLLSHELVKGYGTKGISPRCMFKIDMQKAHDSLEWHFLEEVLSVGDFYKHVGGTINKHYENILNVETCSSLFSSMVKAYSTNVGFDAPTSHTRGKSISLTSKIGESSHSKA
ncbi:hypothetical protein MTR67_048100 [Solanum verrucosum]|uniref:Reverse transcriptase domain-containing protein n=1 Tax=Solanum verrucosum TaxID=315347 RepID=A0AAF0UXQ5_SOLVR|nr:hypothetical protein MTR67_048100 [Solanum verrucosum]